MKKILQYLLIISLAKESYAQIPNPAVDPNFYLYTPLSDEFDGATLSSKWQVDVALWNKDSVNEIRSTNRPVNVSVSGGKLYLSGSDIPYGADHYTQGLIQATTLVKKGCYLETLCLFDTSKFNYAGFWMYEGNDDSGLSCNYREIDIMEYNGHNSYSTANIHYCKNYMRSAYPEFYYQVPNLNVAHKFSCFWDNKNITILKDGITVRDTPIVFALDQPMKLILHGGIDFNYIIHPDTRYPPSLPVTNVTEYVRVYRLKLDCGTIVTRIPDFSTYYYALKKSIELDGTTIVPSGSTISLRATDYINLLPGFEVPNGTDFSLNTNTCDSP